MRGQHQAGDVRRPITHSINSHFLPRPSPPDSRHSSVTKKSPRPLTLLHPIIGSVWDGSVGPDTTLHGGFAGSVKSEKSLLPPRTRPGPRVPVDIPLLSRRGSRTGHNRVPSPFTFTEVDPYSGPVPRHLPWSFRPPTLLPRYAPTL